MMFEQHMPQPDPVYTCNRPIPDAMAEVKDAAANVSDLINAWRAAGEITVTVDVFGVAKALTLHIPLPKA